MTDVDTRLRRWKAEIDDLRCEVQDFLEECDCAPLVRVQQYANWQLMALDEAVKVLEEKRSAL